jgi:hypothetical protein
MKKNILLLGDYIVDEFLEDLCEIDSDYKVSHIYVLNVTPRQEKIINNNNIEVIKGWHDFTSLIHEDFNTDILSDPKLKEQAFNIIKNFYRFSDNQDFFYHENVYYELVNYWIHFFKKNKIDLIIGGNPSFLESITTMVAEKIFGIRTITRKLLSRQPEDNSYRMYFFDNKNEMAIPLHLDKEFKIESLLFPDYSKLKFKKRPKILVEIVRALINFKVSSLLFIFGNVLNFFKLKKDIKNMVISPDLDTDFIYYPLHFDPEIVTMPEEDVRANQGLNIKKLAASLPKDWILYVKIHPNQFNFKLNFWVWEFYGNVMKYYMSFQNIYYLSQIPNVKFIDTSISQKELIQSSKSIASISGSVFLEASFYQKPILVFGKKTLYKQLNNSFFVESNKEIKEAIEEFQKDKVYDSNIESIFQNYTYSSKTTFKKEILHELILYLTNSKTKP